MLSFAPVLFLAGAALAADQDLNGRWDIKVLNEPRSRVWWLEVEGAGAGKAKGNFVGAPGGQLDPVTDMKIKDGTLEFRFQRSYERGKPEPLRTGIYRAKVENGKLVGSLEVEGYPQGARKFEGVRAPVINEKDDAGWKPSGKPMDLFNGKDMKGWKAMVPGQDLGWWVKDGLLTNKAGANNLVSEEKFWNFELHVEYKLGKGSNSGIGLRGRYEVQIFDDFGQPADSHGNGALYSRIKPSVNASKPADEWQTFDIRLVGRTVTVVLNGQKIIDKAEIAGLTAIANDCDEALPGHITIQGDHGAVEFRKVSITQLANSAKTSELSRQVVFRTNLMSQTGEYHRFCRAYEQLAG